MADLLFGLETEYALSGVAPSGPIEQHEFLTHLFDLALQELAFLPDLGSHGGIYLQNGSKFYIDLSHPEMCTPECTTPWEAVRYTEAGHRILADLIARVESTKMRGAELMAFRCNVDYSGAQTTWGCHESYLYRTSLDTLQPHLIPHLVSRLIYTGAGGFNFRARGLEFTLSPRVAHLQEVISGDSTNERGIWHTKDEALCSGYHRLHILCGESLCSQAASWLKVGVTALIVAMADAGIAPGSAVQLAKPLAAMQEVAGDVTCKKTLRMDDGRRLTALAIQRHYLEQAEAHVGASFMPDWAPEVCRRWRAILDQLEGAPSSIERTLDWGIKLALYQDRARRLGIDWDALTFRNHLAHRSSAPLDAEGGEPSTPEFAVGPESPFPGEAATLDPLSRDRGLDGQDPKRLLRARQELCEIDTRFGQLGSKSIFSALELAGVLDHRVNGVDRIEQAMTEPPASGRARIRGQVIKCLAGTDSVRCDWQQIVNFQERQILDLSNPFTQGGKWRRLRQGEKCAWMEVNPDCIACREEAFRRYSRGDYASAESLLRRLLQEGFAPPDTHCHIARVQMMMDRPEEAREQIRLAWAARGLADAYVVPRVLFFQCLFAMLDGVAVAPLIRRVRAALCGPQAHMDWTIQPMLDHLRPQLGETNYQFLSALAKALSAESGLPDLDVFPQWQEAAAPAADRGTGAARSPRRRQQAAGG
jgi:proteasome accessory factor A